jgi:hypothetical protein
VGVGWRDRIRSVCGGGIDGGGTDGDAAGGDEAPGSEGWRGRTSGVIGEPSVCVMRPGRSRPRGRESSGGGGAWGDEPGVNGPMAVLRRSAPGRSTGAAPALRFAPPDSGM